MGPRYQADFVEALRDARITPHVAQDTSNCSSSIDGRTTRHSSYAVINSPKEVSPLAGGTSFILGSSVMERP